MTVVKALAAGDKLPAPHLSQSILEFKPTFKAIMPTNHRPTIRGSDDGIWRRIRLVPWRIKIADAEVDNALSDRLAGELPGIPAAEGLRITVSVSGPANVNVVLQGYRLRYAPNRP